MTSSNLDTVRSLLADVPRLRAIARHLVRDAAQADDLVQDALVAALERDRPEVREASGWIWTVLRNLARNSARAQAASKEREREFARPELTEDANAGAAAAQRARDLGEAVVGLDEPYRTAISLRYFEDVQPKEIARRTGANVETVQKRLTRGKAELRRKLESRYGDRGAWAVALLPLTGRDILPTATLVLGWGGAVRAAAALALVGAAGFGIVRWLEPELNEPGAHREALVSLDELVPIADISPRSLEERVELAAGASAPTPTIKPAKNVDGDEATSVAAPPVTFRVLDLEGHPLPGVKFNWLNKGRTDVRVRFGTTTYTSLPESRWKRRTFSADENGLIQFDGYPPKSKRNETWQPDSERLGILGDGLDEDGVRTLVLTPLVRVAGTAIDREGRPLSGIPVRANAGLSAVGGFPLVLRNTAVTSWLNRGTATTDEGGAFDLGFIPTHADFSITAVRDSYAFVVVEVPAVDDFRMTIELPNASVRPTAEVFGVVLDHDGNVVPKVRVRHGQDNALTDDQGRFRIVHQGSYPSPPVLTVGLRRGRFTAAPGPSRTEALADGGAGPFTLRLPRSMSRLRGRLVDAKGVSMLGMELVLLGATRVGSWDRWYEYGRRRVSRSEPFVTGRAGTFIIPHVLDREYHLRFIDRDSMLVHDVEGVHPKDGPILVQIPPDAFLDELTGRVVDYYGEPIPRAEVSLSVVFSSSPRRSSSFSGKQTVTDTMGRFRIPHASWRGVDLRVKSPTAVGGGVNRVHLADFNVQAPIEVALDLECPARVDEATLTGIDRIRFLDAEGERVTVMEIHSGVHIGQWALGRASGGRFPNFTLRQRAVTAALMNGEAVVRLVPIQLSVNELNRLSL